MIKLKTDVREILEGYRDNREENLSSLKCCPERKKATISKLYAEVLKKIS